jgi:phosphatidylinositol dimannoside acyltransferase
VTDGPRRATASSSRERRLEAPHRRGGARPRIVERLAILGYRATAWLLARVSPAAARPVLGRLAQASYLLWPTKRRWSNRNFGHVLGLPPSDPRVRRLAMRAYGEYGRYLVELMRLPSRPLSEVADLVPDLDSDEVISLWRGAPNGGGLIFAVGHVGNNEAVAAAIARHGLPISVVADDSSFPELFELLRRQRESWGVQVVAWRNLRAIYGVLRRREMLALLVDWGYRSDGIPVRLFGAWTALPAGPATLAARTGSRILPVGIHRQPDDRFNVAWGEAIDIRSGDPAELQRVTQLLADALAATVSAAPAQWYSFKPIWPATDAEAADLERRALLMQAGRPDPGPDRAWAPTDGDAAVEGGAAKGEAAS